MQEFSEVSGGYVIRRDDEPEWLILPVATGYGALRPDQVQYYSVRQNAENALNLLRHFMGLEMALQEYRGWYILYNPAALKTYATLDQLREALLDPAPKTA